MSRLRIFLNVAGWFWIGYFIAVALIAAQVV